MYIFFCFSLPFQNKKKTKTKPANFKIYDPLGYFLADIFGKPSKVAIIRQTSCKFSKVINLNHKRG